MKKHVFGQTLASATIAALLVPALMSSAHAEPLADGQPSPEVGTLAGGTEVTIDLPEPPLGPDLVSIHAGSFTTLALGADGNVYGWGANKIGGVGNGTNKEQPAPVRTHLPAGAKVLDYETGLNNSYAVLDDGSAYSWGAHDQGQLGIGPAYFPLREPVPIAVPEGVTFAEILAGKNFAIALDTEGNAYGWGKNEQGQIGQGSANTSAVERVPAAVMMPEGVTFTSVSTVGTHTLAIGSDGNTYAWGYSNQGLLGIANESPKAIKEPTRVTTPRGVKYTKVIAGWNYSLGLGDDGKLYSWGSNAHGYLGIGSKTASKTATPVALPGGTYVKDVSSGGEHALVLTEEGEIYAWGLNKNGEVGNGVVLNAQGEVAEGKEADVEQPVLVQSPDGVRFTTINAGDGFSFGIAEDGTSYGWGRNELSQLGNGTHKGTSVPVPVSLPIVTAEATEVLFDGVPGTHLKNAGDKVTVVTPAGTGYGAVDVQLGWAANTIAQHPVTFEKGFTYIDLPRVSEASESSGLLGDTVTFSTELFGSPAPQLTWSFSIDGGATWAAVSKDRGESVSTDGAQLSVTITPESAETLYRVHAVNDYGEATSDSFTISVPNYQVTFESAGGTAIEPVTVIGGASLSKPADPERGGFTFTGWYTDEGTETPYDFEALVTGEMTLFAGWSEKKDPGVDAVPTDPIDPVDPTKPTPTKPGETPGGPGLATTGQAGIGSVMLGVAALLLLSVGGVFFARRTRPTAKQ
ncbi:InlB B-repeat-containing protein [Leucobacter sp. UCMA 4100]|uniref:RCC1 domain-containing protein n=1 Tax=Leucobacter sp. UCMA 4100 TaxID=2810534 RepID=UPI0022EA7F4B|nr:InlB B-repeat-containing protein [Leucobacter sp. UCMA 4100]MDA3146326.1 InlB B-repeat-containing protein [Leucobacter sp. UCMA 4100]